MDGMLSQEEINALLAGASGSGDSSTTDSSADNNAQNAAGQEDNNNTPSAQNEQQFVLSDSEKDAVGEISNRYFYNKEVICEKRFLTKI